MKPFALKGCNPDPLGNYLKGLGVFRLVAEQLDGDARVWWKDDCLWIASSSLDGIDPLLSWLATAYQPTPLLAPWKKASGFWPDEPKEGKKSSARRAGALNALRRLAEGRGRFAKFAPAVRQYLALLSASRLPETIQELSDDNRLTLKALDSQTKKDATRASLHRGLRNRSTSWPVLRWLDAVGVTLPEAAGRQRRTSQFFDLLADGGGEGNAAFTGNFNELLLAELDPTTCDAARTSWERLRHALTGSNGAVTESELGGSQYFPRSVETYNSGQGFVSKPKKRLNPWEFILMLEGALVWASAVTRRLGATEQGRASFPFFCDSTQGWPTQGPREASGREAKTRGELWCPLWERPMTYAELAQIFGAGRVQVGARTARTAIEFVRGLTQLGIDRGISAFARVGLLKRGGSGDQLTSLAVPLGRFAPRRLPALDVLNSLDAFYRDVSRLVYDHPQMPRRVILARERMERAVFEAVAAQVGTRSDSGGAQLLACLSSAAALEKELAVTSGTVKVKIGDTVAERSVSPLQPVQLGAKTRGELDDGSVEYRLAAAVASLRSWGRTGDRSGRKRAAVESVRPYLMPVERRGNGWAWVAKGRANSAVWSKGDLLSNLAAVLQRRLTEASKGTGEGLPLWATEGASFTDLLALWRGEVDESRLEDLVHALALIDWKPQDDARKAGSERRPDLTEEAVDPDDPSRRGHVSEEPKAAAQLPRAYCLLKLCFLGGRLPPRPVEGRIANRSEHDPFPPLAPEILSLLLGGRLADALLIAARKLRAKGYPAIATDDVLHRGEFVLSKHDCRRLVGMLLIPVRWPGLLTALAVRPRTN